MFIPSWLERVFESERETCVPFYNVSFYIQTWHMERATFVSGYAEPLQQ